MTKFISACFLFFALSVQAQQFQAPVTDTHWQVIESPLECTLSQTIPDFGEAKFYRQSGGPLQLIFNTRLYPAMAQDIAFEVAQAPWQNSEQRLHLTFAKAALGQTEFVASGLAAEQAFTHMQEGRFPALRYKSNNTPTEISALLSTVHLADSISGFQQCLSALHPDTFENVRKLTVHFALESTGLSRASRKALDRVADYVKVDDSITRIVIKGHTDNHGRRRLNGPLSEQRAMAVKNYFVKVSKLPAKLFITSGHLERAPKSTNKTNKGRALNRRAEIELFR